jgi:lysophospholipase L1-like esterase
MFGAATLAKVLGWFTGINWGSILKFFFIALPTLLVVGLFWYAFFVIEPQNKHLQDQLTQANAQYSSLNQAFTKYQQANDQVVQGISAQITTQQQQTDVKKRIHSVPVKESGKPFDDAGMRQRADILRQYQQTSPVFGQPSTNSSN